MVELLLGAGSKHEKRFTVDGNEAWKELVTLDINEAHKPDVVWDLTKRPLPFEDNKFDELHAYEVLEHLGQQGDWRTWFAEWSEWWRILKPGGVLFATSPAPDSVWVWADPGHTRAILMESLTYLEQPQYTKQIGKTTMTDYRMVYRVDFDLIYCKVEGETLQYALQAIKPSRISL